MGVASRVFHTGFQLFDAYLGDALYAVLFYLLLSLFWDKGVPLAKASSIMVLMILIESFQLTLIPLNFRLSSNIFLRLLSIVLGTKFAWLDLVSYAVGILAIFLLEHLSDRWLRPQAQRPDVVQGPGNLLKDGSSG
jgi:hypothetical protein